MLKDKKNLKNLINVSIITVCLCLIALIIGYSFAWLTDIFNDDGDAQIGAVKIEIYDGETKLNGTTNDDGSYTVGTAYAVNLGDVGSVSSLNLKVKNVGTINGIVRCFVTISTVVGPSEGFTDLDGASYLATSKQLKVESPDWVDLYDDPLLEGVYGYNMFLNKVLAPDAENIVFTNFTVLSEVENTTVYVKLRADIVAHSGNAYQIDNDKNPVADKDKPFGVLTKEFLDIWTAYK